MGDEFKRKPNESLLQYRARLYRNKISLGMNNKEIYEFYIEQTVDTISESTCRCSATIYNQALEDCLENEPNNVNGDILLDIEEKRADLELKTRELIKERKKLQTTKIESNRILTHEARFELFYENIKDKIMRLPLPEFYEINPKVGGGYSEDVQVITDIHYGASFKSQNNEYSTKICQDRFDLLLSETITYCLKNNLTKLNILELGDSIQGMLRMTDLKLNEIPIVQAVVEISRIIANYLNQLSKYVYIDYYHTMQSNHSQTRPLGSKASEIATEDMELVIGNYIKDLLADNDRVNVKLSSRDYFSMNVCGYDCIGMHGHQVKNIRSVIKDYSILHRKFYQYAFLGHFHGGQTMSVAEGRDNTIEILVSPSFIGSDTYSDSLMVGSKAMSRIYKFEEGKGLIQTTNIILN